MCCLGRRLDPSRLPHGRQILLWGKLQLWFPSFLLAPDQSEEKKREHDLREEYGRLSFWQLSWQDLTHVLVTPKVHLEDFPQGMGTVLTMGTPKTGARNAQKTAPSLYPKCHAHYPKRWMRKFPQLQKKWGNLPMPVMAVIDWPDLGPSKASEKTVTITQEVLLVIVNMASNLVQYLVAMGATYCVLTSYTGPFASETCSVISVQEKL